MKNVSDTPEQITENGDDTDLTIVLLGLLPMLPKLQNSDVRVLMAIARMTQQQGSQGLCVLHQFALAELAGITRSTVHEAVGRLERAGLIDVFSGRGGASGSFPNTYSIIVDEFYRAIFNDEHLTSMLYPDGLPPYLIDDGEPLH